MQDIHARIKALEKEIEQVKSQFSLGKASLDFSKKRVSQLEAQLSHLVEKLPEHEREIYMLRREFGKEF